MFKKKYKYWTEEYIKKNNTSDFASCVFIYYLFPLFFLGYFRYINKEGTERFSEVIFNTKDEANKAILEHYKTIKNYEKYCENDSIVKVIKKEVTIS